MQIHDLILDNVRGIEHLELRDLPATGVIIIDGDNETGKSTILDALDAVLYEKSSFGNAKVKSLQPIGRDVGPAITLTASVGPYRFTIFKKFLRSKRSELNITAPEAQQLSGREADDKLLAIVGEHLEQELAQTLFLRQGAIDPGIAAVGIPSITRALDSSSGEAEAGLEDTELTTRVAKEYHRYFDANGKEKITLKRLRDQVDKLAQVEKDKRAEVAELAAAVEEVHRRSAEIAGIDKELPAARDELAQKEAEAAAALAVRAEAAAALEQVQRAEVDVNRAREDVAARDEQEHRLSHLREDAAALAEKIAAARLKATEEAEAVDDLVAARDDARRVFDSARKAAAAARAGREVALAAQRFRELTQQLARIDTAEAALSALLRDTPARPVTPEDVRRVENAANQVALYRKLAEATAAKLDVTPGEDTSITIDGVRRDLTAGTTTPLTLREGTEITLEGITAVYRAGGADSCTEEDLLAAEQELNKVLEETGCANVDEARATRDNHARHTAEVAAARAKLDELTEGHDVHALRAEHDLLAKDETLAAAGELDAAEAAVEEAENAREEAEAKQAQAEAALKPWEERKAATALVRLETEKELKDAEIDHSAAVLAAAGEKATSEQLRTNLMKAEVDQREAKKVSVELEDKLAQANPELAEELLRGAETRLTSLKQRREAAERRILELGSYINVATGVAEQADRAEAELDTARARLQRTLRRADAARLLWDTMRRHRDEARARYAQPFAKALAGHASVVFGHGVEFNLDEELRVTGRTINGTTVPLEELSGGAKEQMAILTRFAIAELAGQTQKGHTPAPVVVDDALGATDPRRIALMNSLFTRAGKTAQVFVFTCDPQRFDRVDAVRRASISELKSEVI
ncbi:AAA family ATPase [Corynebacterium mayonis]|uniref:AAA family ATPase n=1 Tax=Corynebacterium mayonis TaxID=3062461 RepID=UPI003140796F